MERFHRPTGLLLAFIFVLHASADPALARNPIRSAFFAVYPGAENTQLDGLPSDSNHCGVCHLDFSGGGQRNPYGLGVEIGINGGMSFTDAILAIEGDDSDNDGFTSLAEITNLLFDNTPTFPGLSAANVGGVSNIPVGEVTPYLTPTGGSDTTPPVVALSSPSGGEMLAPNAFTTVTYTATDASGISHVDFWMSEDSGTTWDYVGRNEAPTGSFSWYVPNRPGGTNRVRVEAWDNAANPGHDDSVADFTIMPWTNGLTGTTLRDMDMPGTQPFEGAILEDVNGCLGCHGDYDSTVEPGHNWGGSPMAQAMLDPLFLAAVAIAEQDAPGAGDLCLRCHTPGGWQEGRSVDTSGGMLTAKDLQGVQCDFCHRSVDPVYVPGISPVEDQAVLADIQPLPAGPANGNFINDPAPVRRGPYADAQAAHAFLDSPFHRSSDICGTCHDVSNPVFVRTGTHDYALDTLDQEHPDFDLRNMFPVERTFSEWSESEYASTGVYAPQFAGDKPDGIVSSCQDCHMRDVTGQGAIGGPVRSDLPLHDFMGGNTFLADVLPLSNPGEVNTIELDAAKQRAIDMLQLAAVLTGTPEAFGLTVRVQNEGAHKLPSGYPEGRRIWLHVEAVDAAGVPVFESGHYDESTGVLTHDEQVKIYEIKPGLSPGLAGALSLPAGPSFHFVLNDTVWSDNRIPPRGFTNAAFDLIQSPPVAYTYADGQYWDDTQYFMPASAETAHVTLYYQTTSKEYVEFLRDANTTNASGQNLHDWWVATGRNAPVEMAEITVPLGEITTDLPEIGASTRGLVNLGPVRPNPFRNRTGVELSLPEAGPVRAVVYDVAGRQVRTVVDGVLAATRHEILWDGRGDDGRPLPAGVYFLEVQADGQTFQRKFVRVR